MKWKRTVLISFLLLASFSAGAFAATQIEKVEAFIRHDYRIVFNGVPADVGPVLVHDGSSYLPLANMAKLLNIDIGFDNKTIYLNERFPGQPEPVEEREVEYDTVTLSYTKGYRAKYLGKEESVFAIIGKSDGKTYYRDIDIRRLGINTSALRKAKDTITKDIFIHEDELKLANGKPEFSQLFERLVIGESDQEKLKSVQNFIDGLPERFKDPDNPDAYNPIPRIIMIEKTGDRTYRVLVEVRNQYVRYTLTLDQNLLGQWYHKESKSEYLGSPNPNSNTGWYYNPDYEFPW